MKGHLTHLLMCLPMLVVAIVLIFSGVGVVALLPVVFCMVMMSMMMRGMSGGGEPGGS